MTAYALLITVVAFVAMEAVSYLTHRFVMQGLGIRIHASHHGERLGTFELNDLYPVMFSSIAIAAFAVGTWLPDMARLLPVGVGITLYGAAYVFVHEIYIHQRVRLIRRPHRVLEWMKRSHRIHHLYGGEPYGMLLPIVPHELRERAAQATYDPFAPRPRIVGA
jgi:beta-carotene 3-hydroxylase